MVDIEDSEEQQSERQQRPSALKLSNSASIFGKKLQEKKDAKSWFEEHAELDFSTKEKRKESSVVLINAFWNIISSKELEENKGPNRLAVEKSIVDDLISFAIETNVDETEKEGMGSIYLISLMMKVLMKQKDRINQLEYQIQKLSK